MFTGIVTARGTVTALDRDGDQLAITIAAPYEDLEPGESVAVNGACLTVVATGEGWLRVHAVATTLGRTLFGDMTRGTEVNLERAMRAGDRFGGHLVQGHVDGVAEVREVRFHDDTTLVDLTVPPDVAEVTVAHGSITVDGVSLTVNEVPKHGVVQISLIPYTREHTTLGNLTPNARVHVEADVIGKYVRQVLQARVAGQSAVTSIKQ